MAVEDVFVAVRDLFRQRVELKIKDYKSLVSAVAAGKKPPAAARVVEILEEAGKTAENFEADVGTAKNRETWRKEIDELATLQEQVAELARKKTALAETHRVESAELASRHGKAFDAVQADWQSAFTRMSVLGRSDPRGKLLETSDEYDTVRKVFSDGPDRETDEALRKDREAALNEINVAKYETHVIARAEPDALGVWPSRGDGQLKERLAAAESRLAQIDEAIARRAAEWESYRKRCDEAEAKSLAS